MVLLATATFTVVSNYERDLAEFSYNSRHSVVMTTTVDSTMAHLGMILFSEKSLLLLDGITRVEVPSIEDGYV